MSTHVSSFSSSNKLHLVGWCWGSCSLFYIFLITQYVADDKRRKQSFMHHFLQKLKDGHTHTHTHTGNNTHTQTNTHSPAHNTHTQTHTHTQARTETHTHRHTHTHTHTHTGCMPLSQSSPSSTFIFSAS